MKILTTTKMAKIGLILGGASSAILMSSCAMSQQKSGQAGAGIGAVGGGILGAIAMKKHGKGKGDVAKGAIIGAGAGSALGGEAGKKASTLPDIGGVILDHL